MRHAVMGFFILIMLIFAGASIYTAETKTMHQNELDSILEQQWKNRWRF